MSEHGEQAAFVQYVHMSYMSHDGFDKMLFFSVPNGAWLGGKSEAQMTKLKEEGFLNGVSDLLYLQPRGGYPYLAIEMKTEKRRKEKDGGVSEDQSNFLNAARSVGAYVAVCYGADEAMKVFDNYMTFQAGKP